MVDLIYLDPPFNSNRTYSAPIGSKAAGAAFKDTWTLSDVDVAEHGLLTDEHPAIYKVIDAAKATHGASMMSYLIMMASRLVEMRRVLKPTGSIYLHCDPTASHYLKLLMDSTFSHTNYVNELIWYYRGAGVPKTSFAKRHDVLLVYARSKGQHLFNPDSIRQAYAPATVARFKHQIGNVRGNRDYGQQELNPKGKHPDDVIAHIQPIAPSAKERLGYPTQKPEPLMEHIINASSNLGDVVLDPFCGCATTLVAAHNLERQWIGIDISSKAVDLVKMRLKDAQRPMFTGIVERDDIPHRTNSLLGGAPPPKQSKHVLYGKQEGNCNGCLIHFPFRNMTVDHVVPQSKGGSDHIDNLQLLCGACNSMKGTKSQAELIVALRAAGLRN